VAADALPFIDLAAQRAALGPSLEAAMARVLAHGQFVLGPEVAELETSLASRAGVSRAISCASGTDAIVLVLMTHGVGPGDAVLVPAFTFAATAGAVALCGATPVFVDVLEDSANLDAELIAPAIEVARAAGLRPCGVIPVDLYGQPADHREIAKAAEAEGLWVLDDAAQSFGATYRNRPVGALTPVTATSFFPSKPLGAYGDGGAIFTDDEDLAELLVSLREHGRGDHRYDIQRVGLNGRLDTLQAAVLLQKLTLFDGELAARAAVADRYETLLADVVRTPALGVARTSTWAQYTVRVDDREAVAAALADEGVPTAVHYPVPLHRQPAYIEAGLVGGDLTVSERLSGEVLSLPMHPYLVHADQQRVADALCRAVGA
jgi:dTDP-4-amino-4,6-dideoxygalactose transaminase